MKSLDTQKIAIDMKLSREYREENDREEEGEEEEISIVHKRRDGKWFHSPTR